MVIAEFSVTPIGEGTSERKVVHAAVEAARKSGLATRVGPFGTALEADTLDTVLEVVKQAHRAALDEGAQRVILELKVDDRRDKRETLQEQSKA